MQETVSEDHYFFMQVEDLCKSPAITCPPDSSVFTAAQLLQHHNISGVVVVDGDQPIGTFSIRDLRRALAESGPDLSATYVRDYMSPHLVTIRLGDNMFAAISKMAQHNVHRLTVLDDSGQLHGVITDTDLMRIKTRTPLYLAQEIETATSVEQLHTISARLTEMVHYALRVGASTKNLVSLISHFNDAFTMRLIRLLEDQEGVRLPAGCAYLVLGSEGREEQTLRTDQDSAVIFADNLSAQQQQELAEFCERLVDGLEKIGVPRCPGNTMASNPEWRDSLSRWKSKAEQWISMPTADNLVNYGMFQDFRTLHGDRNLEAELKRHMLETLQRNTLFLPYMARHIARFHPPLGFFGHIRTERRGEHRGEFDIKKAGIFAITEGISLLCTEAGILGGSTWEKIQRLGSKQIVATSDLAAIEAAFTALVQLRLQKQLKALSAGRRPSNHVNPLVLTDREKDDLRNALKGVNLLLHIIRERYKLDFISR